MCPGSFLLFCSRYLLRLAWHFIIDQKLLGNWVAAHSPSPGQDPLTNSFYACPCRSFARQPELEPAERDLLIPRGPQPTANPFCRAQ